MKFLKFVAIALAIFMVSACGRIETGHSGVRTTWNKTVSSEEVRPGFYVAVTDSVEEYVTNEMTMQLKDQKPQAKDKSYLKDLDITYIYSVDPANLAEMSVKYKNRHMRVNHDIYPMGLYVESLMQSSLARAVSKHEALDMNDQRVAIENDVKAFTTARFADEGLQGKIIINQVVIKNIEVDPQLQSAILNKIRAQKDNETKSIEINTAEKESQRIAKLSQNVGGDNYIRLLNAQANMLIAEGIAGGKVNTIVVPSDFKGIVNTGK